MKVLLITDQHFGVRNDNQAFIDHYKKFYGEIVVPFLKASNIDTVINLGDTFDKRRSINYLSLEAAKEMWFDPLDELGANIFKVSTLFIVDEGRKFPLLSICILVGPECDFSENERQIFQI